MNQNMHTWIATALGVLTVKIIFQKHKFNETIVFVLDLAVPIIYLGVWFYLIY
jgi:hypothetical protein